jgi:hypothetical protein
MAEPMGYGQDGQGLEGADKAGGKRLMQAVPKVPPVGEASAALLGCLAAWLATSP